MSSAANTTSSPKGSNKHGQRRTASPASRPRQQSPAPQSQKQQQASSSSASNPSTSLQLAHTRGVLDYLRLRVPKATLKQLYVDESRGPFVCRAVVQQLSLSSQQLVVRLQCTGGSFPAAGVQVWLQGGERVLKDVVLPELRQWAMIIDVSDNSDNNGGSNAAASEITLTEEFRAGFSASLCRLHTCPWPAIPADQLSAWEKTSASLQQRNKAGLSHGNKRKQPPSNNNGISDDSGTITPEDLERYTQTVWDSVLHFLVGTDHAMEPPAAVVQFLLLTGLMQTDPDYRGSHAETEAPLVITEKGYDFMLQDNYEQVWHFCLQYLQVVSQNKEKGERMVKECLLLLICLSFCGTIGQAYPAAALNKAGRRMLKDLAHFGLLYVRELTIDTEGTTKVIFYPTRVALSLIGTASAALSEDETLIPKQAQWSLSSKALDAALAHPTPHDSSHLAIIVQTNFQVCAYTTSELHVSMLALFCDVSTIRRLPNVVFLYMSRDSVKAAFHLGIQARQILRFLEKHAHPKLRVQNKDTAAQYGLSPIPGNVVDQIWLWDRERTRVQMTLVFQHQCLMEGEFEALYAFSVAHDAHVWSSKRKKLLYLDYNKVQKMTSYVRQWRARMAARQARGAEG